MVGLHRYSYLTVFSFFLVFSVLITNSTPNSFQVVLTITWPLLRKSLSLPWGLQSGLTPCEAAAGWTPHLSLRNPTFLVSGPLSWFLVFFLVFRESILQQPLGDEYMGVKFLRPWLSENSLVPPWVWLEAEFSLRILKALLYCLLTFLVAMEKPNVILMSW